LRQIDPERHAGVHRFRVERSRKEDEHPTGMKIVNVNQMENGIIVNFEEEVCAFFEGSELGSARVPNPDTGLAATFCPACMES